MKGTPDRERIARVMYEAWPERHPALMSTPWSEMMERKQGPWLAMADAVLAAALLAPPTAGA